jgi:hypothetical protein
MCASGGEYSDSGREPWRPPLPITVARQSRIRTGFPQPLDQPNLEPLAAAGEIAWPDLR